MHISSEWIHENFSYHEFIPFLQSFLKKEVSVPDRAHYSIPVPGKVDATLLTMPSWSVGDYFGVKIVSVFPENKDLPTINGAYLLMDGLTGELLCTIDGLALTVKRTAAVSGLASLLLSSPDSAALLMVGTGNLCHELIRAHASVRPIHQVWIWGRNVDKAKLKVNTLALDGVKIEALADKDSIIPAADIVSCATLSDDPLVNGQLLKEGSYLDLVGSFKKGSREADDACLMNANIYVDTYMALEESGDLYIPLQKGLIEKSDIESDLVTICRTGKTGGQAQNNRTFFKSVGFASPDLATAVYLYHKITKHG